MAGLILAGGKSRRMNGQHKGNLVYQEETFVERLIKEMQKETDQIWISYDSFIQKEYPGCNIIMDEYPECGPIGGLYSGLRKCTSQILMVSACDMPFLSVELYWYLRKNLIEAENKRKKIYSGVVPVSEGRCHPLAAIYRTEAVYFLESQIRKKEYKMMKALDKMKILYVDVTGNVRLQRMLLNINTVSEYKKLLEDEWKETQ